MKELLFLTHRIPFPPNKGDKIRSYHLLTFLARHYRVHLGSFIDSPADWQHRAPLEALCGETCFVGLTPWRARLRSARGLLSGAPLSLPYYADRRMHAWVEDLMSRRRIERVFVFCSPMAQYAPAGAALRRVLDFCDLDSDKWRQYAHSRRGPMRWLYARESRLLAQAERRLAGQFDASLFVSEHEAELFRSLAPAESRRVFAVHNGVDTDYFDPAREYSRPFRDPKPQLVFTGAMDYWANVDAVTWFARQVLPDIRRQRPDAGFCIVGSNPTEATRELASLPGVTVTGSVPDVRPYLAHSAGVVAPLRIARGVQNKVLEALAMSRQVVATQAALDGIEGGRISAVAVADDPAAFADAALALLARPDGEAGRAGRAFVQDHYDWSRNLARVMQVMEGTDLADEHAGAAHGRAQ